MSRAARLLTPTLPLALCAALAWQPEPGQSAPAPLLSRRFTNSVKMKLVRLAPGRFLMGSPAGEADRNAEEHRHEVEISRPFYLGVHTVTQKQYQQVMGTNPSCFSKGGAGKDRVKGLDTDDFPVESVSWEGAVAFCKRLSALPAEKGARRVYRLPSEAEWEYACRAGTSTPFHFGNTLDARQANVNSALGRPARVGSYRPNAWGLYDMHGNVWQFCADCYDGNYYRVSPRKDPAGPKAGSYRVARGGSWMNPSRHCRAAIRTCVTPYLTYVSVGFRIACDLGGRR
jgi:formylglycine-generating enzyme required for sulfatase activity